MRHKVKGRKLSRTASHRRATLNALATSLFRHKKIKTTVSKAKEARTFAETLITKAKTDSVASRREVARFIKDKDVLKTLFSEIATAVGERPGGYTRVVKLGNRLGDAAEMAILELVDFAEGNAKPAKEKKAPKAKKVEEPVEAVAETVEEAEVVEETPVVEEEAEAKVEETDASAEETTEEKEDEKK